MNIQKYFSVNIILFITAMFFITSSLFAQERQKPPQIPNETQITKMVEKLSKELSLSENQKTEILALYVNHFAEVKASMEDESGQKKGHEEMENMRAEFEEEVKSLLNEEQQDMFDEFMKKNHKQRKQQKSNGN